MTDTTAPTPAGYAGVARAPFLALPVVLVANGAAAAAYDGSHSWRHTALALAGLLAMHVVVNVRNEISDFETGIDLVTERTPFSGGSGAIPGMLIRPGQARTFGWLMLAVAAAVAAYFLAVIGTPILPIVLGGLLLTLLYTPWLTRLGIGELAAGVGLGLLPVLGAAMVQGGTLGPAAWGAAWPAFFMTFNLLLLNQFPDEQADRAGGRKNLVLQLGRRGAAFVYAVMAVAALGSIGLGVFRGHLPTACLLALLPAAAIVPALSWALRSPEAPVPVPALAGNVIWNLATNALLALGFVLGR